MIAIESPFWHSTAKHPSPLGIPGIIFLRLLAHTLPGVSHETSIVMGVAAGESLLRLGHSCYLVVLRNNDFFFF